MGYFAMFGILLIMVDFIPLLVGMTMSKGDFHSKYIKKTFPIWLLMLIVGMALIIIP